jgi:hypothetical protein
MPGLMTRDARLLLEQRQFQRGIKFVKGERGCQANDSASDNRDIVRFGHH